MIVDRIENINDYKGFNAGIDKAFEFLLDGVSALEAGTVLELGDGVTARCFAYQSQPVSEGLAEAHRAYIDVMFMKEGGENIGYKPVCELKNITKEFDTEIDALLAKEDDMTLLPFNQGCFFVFFPQDAHMGGITAGEPGNVKRVVIKVPVGG